MRVKEKKHWGKNRAEGKGTEGVWGAPNYLFLRSRIKYTVPGIIEGDNGKKKGRLSKFGRTAPYMESRPAGLH